MNNPFIPKIKKLSENTENNVKKIIKAFENKKDDKPSAISEIFNSKKGLGLCDVAYKTRTIDVEGQRIKGEFPVFNSVFDTKLPKELYKASDYKQFKYCTKQLAKAIKWNPILRSKFSERQIRQIENGDARISGYTWHHHETSGKMQLVKTSEHNTNHHTGGRSTWGGGSRYRLMAGI